MSDDDDDDDILDDVTRDAETAVERKRSLRTKAGKSKSGVCKMDAASSAAAAATDDDSCSAVAVEAEAKSNRSGPTRRPSTRVRRRCKDVS